MIHDPEVVDPATYVLIELNHTTGCWVREGSDLGGSLLPIQSLAQQLQKSANQYNFNCIISCPVQCSHNVQ